MARIKQGIGQLIGPFLGRGDGQQIDIRVGVPVAAGQRAEQPHLRIGTTSHDGLGPFTQLVEPCETALLTDGGEGADGVRLRRIS